MLHDDDDDDDDDFDGTYEGAYQDGWFYACEEYREGLDYNPEYLEDDDFSLEYDAWCDGYMDFWNMKSGIEYD